MTILTRPDYKLSSANRSVGCGSLNVDLLGFFPAKEIPGALLKVQARLGARSRGRQNLSFEELIDPEETRVTQSSGGAAIFTCPQPVPPGQLLTDNHRLPLSS